MPEALLDQIRHLVAWFADGRPLTKTGAVTLADARALVLLLGTADVVDPVVGSRTFRTKSSTELGELSLLVAWAKAARLLRTASGRLVAVRSRAAVLDDPDRLWLLLHDTLAKAGPAVLRSGWGETLLRREFDDALAEIRACVARGPVERSEIQERVWKVVTARYDLGEATEHQLETARKLHDGDVDRVLHVLDRLGEITVADDRIEPTAHARRLLGLSDDPGTVLRLTATLVDVDDPPVRRTLLLPAAFTLEQLHGVLQAAFGWEDYHLHAFTIGGLRYGVPDPELGFRDERSTRLADLPRRGPWLYEYDFGDSWEHAIHVEQVGPGEPGTAYPACVDGTGACPPEDCGGAGGYQRLKEVLADPRHPEHEDMCEWLGLDEGAEFDPRAFDLTGTNADLARG